MYTKRSGTGIRTDTGTGRGTDTGTYTGTGTETGKNKSQLHLPLIQKSKLTSHISRSLSSAL